MIIGGIKICDGYECAYDLPRNKNAIYRWKDLEFCSKICKAREIRKGTAEVQEI